MANFITEKYDYFINNLADPRVEGWYGFQGFSLTLTIVTSYLLMVYILLPAYMKNRKPYDLKRFLYFYNIFQIGACSCLVYGMATSGWTTTYNWMCQPVDYSSSPQAMSMLTWCYYTHILKGIDLIETFVFILRKKHNQASLLHVYHHVSTFILSWILVKFIGGGMATFPVIINNFIHVLMYTYYLLSSFGKEWQKKMKKIKPKLTLLQMVSFFVMIGHACFSLQRDCHVPKQVLLFFVPNIGLVFLLFWDFYKNTYLARRKVN